MDYDEISSLQRHDPSWRLLRAENAPLILEFLGRVFVEENIRSISATELIGRLDDKLYGLRERLGDDAYPKSAKAYLDDWAMADKGWLRKYYPEGSDEPHFDATPAVEKTITWLKSLRARSFIGTESRLNTVFDLLRQMVHGSETDPEIRLAELYARRTALDQEIERVAAGHFEVPGPSALRDQYQQFAATAQQLLADFREVEANFRALDRDLRERISAWSGSKGELLDDVVGSREAITDTDQGRSFQAFYDLLLSSARQEELTSLLDQVHSLDVIPDTDLRMRHIHHAWLDAGERTQETVRRLSEQLRRFLDDQVWFENRRVVDILREIESTALRLRDRGDIPLTMEIDDTAPSIALPMERPLYTALERTPIDSAAVEAGRHDGNVDGLFEQVHVDPGRLAANVRAALHRDSQIGLTELLRQHPLDQGLAELVVYLSLADEGFRTVFDEEIRERIGWQDEDGTERRATLPKVIFARDSLASAAQDHGEPTG